MTDWVSAGSAVVVAISAAVAACSAYSGINTWRQQMRGKDEYRLARNLLAAIYKHRDAMHDARHRFVTIADRPPRAEAAEMTPEQIKYYGLSRTYSRRWKKVEGQHQRIYRNLIFAEAIWGSELRELLGSLLEPEQDLKVAIDTNLWFMNPDNKFSWGDSRDQDMKELRPTLYGEPADEFGQQIENGIKPAEEYLKRKLGTALDG